MTSFCFRLPTAIPLVTLLLFAGCGGDLRSKSDSSSDLAFFGPREAPNAVCTDSNEFYDYRLTYLQSTQAFTIRVQSKHNDQSFLLPLHVNHRESTQGMIALQTENGSIRLTVQARETSNEIVLYFRGYHNYAAEGRQLPFSWSCW